MDFIFDLGLFSGKVLVLAGAAGLLMILLFTLILRARQGKPAINVEHINRKYERTEQALTTRIWDKARVKAEARARRKREKRDARAPKDGPRLYVIDFVGDLRATRVENLREEVTAVLLVARPGPDAVLVRVESPGGVVHAYGLAATQLARIRAAGVRLAVSVDKVAASGGYMMACVGEKILAAPFAIVGSIGVVAQVPNFHRLLKKHDVDFEEITAGEFKRTVTMFGEITDKGRRKFMDQIEDTHGLFKNFVGTYRPQLNLASVATGEYWFGQLAQALGLVDEITTSDDYLFRRRAEVAIYRVEIAIKKKWSEKLSENIARAIVTLAERAAETIFTRSKS